MTKSDYWYTDTESDEVSSLSAAADFLDRATSDSNYWKWSVVALHSAVQGLLTLSLRQGNALLVQKPGRAKEILSALEGGPGRIEPYMDNFMGLYRKAQDPANFLGSQPPVPPDCTLERAVEVFDQWRHEFLHFNSKGWSINIPMLVSRCHSASLVAEHILKSGGILWHSDDLAAESQTQLERVQRALG